MLMAYQLWNTMVIIPDFAYTHTQTRRSNPEKMFLKVPFYSSSVHKSKVHFNKSFSYDAPKLWNDLPLEI